MKNKRLLFLLTDIWSLGKNKGVISLYEILKQCHKNNHLVIFTTDKNNLEEEFNNAQVFYFKPTINIHSNNKYLKFTISKLNIYILNIKYIFQFLLLKNKNFHIQYCSSSTPIYSSIFIKTIFNIPSIHRMYGTFLYPILGKYLYYIKNFEEIIFYNSNASHYIITDDGTHGDKVAKHFNILDSKVSFLRNGVRRYPKKYTKVELYEKYQLNPNTFYLLSVSRLVHWKRVDRTILALKKIKNINVSLLIVGDGPEKENLKSITDNKCIKFLGSKTHKEIRELMNLTDIFISMYDLSNLGNPLLEALVEGCAIITYASGNTSSVINNQNGILIPFQDNDEKYIINQLAYTIESLHSDEDALALLRKNAFQYSKDNLKSWEDRIQQEMNILNKISTRPKSNL